MIAMRELHRDRDESSWPTVDVARKVLVCLYEDLPHFWNFCCQVGLFQRLSRRDGHSAVWWGTSPKCRRRTRGVGQNLARKDAEEGA